MQESSTGLLPVNLRCSACPYECTASSSSSSRRSQTGCSSLALDCRQPISVGVARMEEQLFRCATCQAVLQPGTAIFWL